MPPVWLLLQVAAHHVFTDPNAGGDLMVRHAFGLQQQRFHLHLHTWVRMVIPLLTCPLDSLLPADRPLSPQHHKCAVCGASGLYLLATCPARLSFALYVCDAMAGATFSRPRGSLLLGGTHSGSPVEFYSCLLRLVAWRSCCALN